MTAITLYSLKCKKPVKVQSAEVRVKSTPKGRKLAIACKDTKKCGRACTLISNRKAKGPGRPKGSGKKA